MPTISPSSFWLQLPSLAIAGALSGALAKWADGSRYLWLADLGTYPAVWILALVVIASLASSPPFAAGRTAAFFLAMCLAYYAYAEVVLDFPPTDVERVWLLVGATVAPAAAATINHARRLGGHATGVAAALSVASVLASGRLRPIVRFDPINPLQLFNSPQAIAEIAVALAVFLLIARSRSDRLLGAAWLGPALLAAPTIVARAEQIVY